MSNVTNEEKFEQLEKSNQIILGVANQYLKNQLEIQQSQKSSSDKELSSNKEIRNTMTAIKGEVSKITDKEFTIAVVGEVKAGKSTFINALVGYDIAHARTKAATTYPVKIKHKKEHNKSSIKLDVPSVFWNDVEKIQKTLQQQDFTQNVNLVDFTNTLEYVKAGNFTKDNYNRDNLEIEEVRKLLGILHDLPRVSKIIDSKLSIENITKDVIPEISLEFPTIRLNADNQEGVILIDTPGLGEGSDLKGPIADTVQTEIQKASAVMVVLEKGGRGSSNENDITKLMKLADKSYVIAGKMDDYNNDNNDKPINELLENIKTNYKEYNCKNAFAVAQLQAIQAIKVQDYFDKHNGTLEDPHTSDNFKKHPSYAILKGALDIKSRKKIDNKENGYEELLHNEDFKEAILELLNPDEYPFTDITDEFKNLASNVLENILPSSKSKFIKNAKILKSNINETLVLIEGGVEKAQKTFNLMSDLKIEMGKVSSVINNQITTQTNNINQFKENLKNETMSDLKDLFVEYQDKISEDDLKNNQPIGIKAFNKVFSLMKGNNKTYQESDEEPAIDYIIKTCEKLVSNMQVKAVDKTKHITEELSNLSKGAIEKLIILSKDYTKTLTVNYEGITTPTLDAYKKPEQSSSIDKNKISKKINDNTKKKEKYSEVSTSKWYNPLSWFSTEITSDPYYVFDEKQFYEDLKDIVKNIIDSTFVQIEGNIKDNTSEVKRFQNDLNNRINATMSKLKDMDQYSTNIELANKIKKDYAEFIETIDLHQELITKF